MTDETGEAFATLVTIEGPVNSFRLISKTSTSCWECESKEEQPTLMKATFRDFTKKDGSIGDFAECNRNINFLTGEDKAGLIWSLEDHKTGETFKHYELTFA